MLFNRSAYSAGPTSQNNSKLNHGSIENGSAAFDLPPEGQKKERWAVSCPYAYIGPWRGSYRTLSGIDVDVGRRGMTGMDMRELEIRQVPEFRNVIWCILEPRFPSNAFAARNVAAGAAAA